MSFFPESRLTHIEERTITIVKDVRSGLPSAEAIPQLVN